MRALWVLVLCGACYEEAAVAPCTLTCESAPCPGDLVCGSDKVCQAPGMPACSMTNPGTRVIEVKAPNADQGDLFGRSVAVSADGVWLVVGALGEASTAANLDGDQLDNSKPQAGAVYVYQWDGTTYVFRTYVKSFAPDNGDQFGISVAISANGNMLVVGAPGEDGMGTDLGVGGGPSNNAVSGSGAVFIYQRSSTVAPWIPTIYLKAPAPLLDGGFGSSVAVSADGTYVAVGQPGNKEAYRYKFTPTLMGVSLAAQSTVGSDQVGFPVALSGDGQTLFGGAQFEDGPSMGCGGDPSQNTATDAGAVFLMSQNGGQHAYCKASNTDAGDRFGASIATSFAADEFAVGAPDEDSAAVGTDGNQGNTTTEAGAVYTFARSAPAAWRPEHYVKPSNTSAEDNFGTSIAMTADGTYMVVGAPGEGSADPMNDRNEDAPRSGAVHVFSKSPTEWQLRAYLKAPTIEAGAELGWSVAISDDHAVVAAGAHFANFNTGVVYVFR